MKNSKLYKEFMQFLEVLKPMTWTKRIDHIWYHYKEGIIIGAILMVLPIGMISSYLNSQYETLFGGAIINVDGTQECRTYLTDDYFEELNGDPKSQRVDLTVLAFEMPNSETNLEYNYNAAMTTVAMIESKLLDYVILDQFAMEYYIAEEIYMDLSLIFSEDELAQLEQEYNVIYAMAEGTSNRVPIVIEITETKFAQGCLNVEDSIYFGFVGPDENAEAYHAFWEYLMAWKGSSDSTDTAA